MYLLTTDWHLDNNPDNEYRWQVFEAIRAAKARYKITHTFCLGDMVDRNDRFTADFINRLIAELNTIAPTTILRGNHDTRMHPPAYFSFLTEEYLNAGINYVSDPIAFDQTLLLLPFSPRPKQEWADLKLASYKCAFMHATVNGAVAENGMMMENPGFPMLPGRVKFYSGDIHTPQTVRNVTYVGCPHHVKFGDRYPTRMLVIDPETFDTVYEVRTSPPRKLMVDIVDISQLSRIEVHPGDQVKLRFNCDPSDIDKFGEAEKRIAAWAAQHGIVIAGTEVIVGSEFDRNLDLEQNPETILQQFANQEHLTDDVVEVGLSLLREVQ